MYFSTGGAADGTGQAAAYEAGKLVGVLPLTTGTTAAYFERNLGEWDNKSGRDKIVFTHDNTTKGVGHRCKLIARAMGRAMNAQPHTNGMVDVCDVDNDIYFDGFADIKGDSGFDIVITLDS